MSALNNQELEAQFSKRVLKMLEPDFEVLGTEVRGVFPQTKGDVRIDAIISPRLKSDWKNKDVVFGLEFKSPRTASGVGDVTRLIRQAQDYTRTYFHPYGYIPIIICPGIKPYFERQPDRHISKAVYFFMSRLLGKNDIYELRNTKKDGIAITHNGDHVIWSQKRGVKDGRHMSLEVKFCNTKRGAHGSTAA